MFMDLVAASFVSLRWKGSGPPTPRNAGEGISQPLFRLLPHLSFKSLKDLGVVLWFLHNSCTPKVEPKWLRIGEGGHTPGEPLPKKGCRTAVLGEHHSLWKHTYLWRQILGNVTSSAPLSSVPIQYRHRHAHKHTIASCIIWAQNQIELRTYQCAWSTLMHNDQSLIIKQRKCPHDL